MKVHVHFCIIKTRTLIGFYRGCNQYDKRSSQYKAEQTLN